MNTDEISKKMELLFDMGYKNFKRNFEVLKKCHFIIENAVTILLSEGYWSLIYLLKFKLINNLWRIINTI